MDEAEQKLNKNEEKSFVHFEIVLETQKELEEEYKKHPNYQNNQDYYYYLYIH